MSEPYSAFLRLRISRADLARWLAAAPPDVSRWSDWRSIGGQWSLPGGGDLSDPDAPGLQTLISDCNAMLARHRDNRAALEFVLGSAEAENIRIAAYDHQGRHFVAGSLTYSESLYDILFFLALGRSAAEFLATDDAGLVVVHDYLWGEDGERRTENGRRAWPRWKRILRIPGARRLRCRRPRVRRTGRGDAGWTGRSGLLPTRSAAGSAGLIPRISYC